ncbi:MAG: hypothetical protein FP831_06015, partial [Anaerolineae bacterium]|nr:hypothetical protein [Anaerolineae bacterium]
MNFESIISISLGLIGIITGLIFFLLSIRKKEFTYIIETENLITNDIAQYSGLEFFYNKNKVRNLSFGKVLIMNTGKEPITKKDLTTINPIALKFSENAKILYSSLIFQSSVSNQWKLFTQEGKNELYFQFDYLDYKQGVVIIFVYEADPNSKIT